MKNEKVDWFSWLGIPESSHEKLLSEAKSHGVPVFDSDSSKDIFNRILALRTYKANRQTVIINLALTIITLSSTVIAVFNLLDR